MYENSTDIIFNQIYMRLNRRKKEMNISSKDLIPDNPNLASAILHNRREPKKNPYLIPDTHISSIMNSLNFKSKNELLFGTNEEIESYAYSLFRALIIDTIEMDDNDKSKAIKKYGKKDDIFNKLESVLTDYVPYALISIYVENPTFSDFAFPKELLEIIDRGMFIRDEAIERLYKSEKIRYSFTDLLVKNVSEKDSVVRLDKIFLDFVITVFLDYLIAQTSDKDIYSLGNRIYRELTELLNEWESLENCNSESRILISEKEAYHREIICGLITASFEYAHNLYNLQKNASLKTY